MDMASEGIGALRQVGAPAAARAASPTRDRPGIQGKESEVFAMKKPQTFYELNGYPWKVMTWQQWEEMKRGRYLPEGW